MQGALSGVRVLDFTEYVAGPYCGQMLADMGATVTKFEPPLGDFWRLTNMVAADESRGFISVNRGKRSISVDLKAPAGLEIVQRAVRDADVMLSSYRPGVAERLGVDYTTLSKLNPRLIYAENSAFGSRGPYAGKPGFDLISQAMTGILAFESQGRDGPPRGITSAAITDFCSGVFMAYAVTSALYQRERTGRGQRIETSLFASGLALQYRPLLSIEMFDRQQREDVLALLDEARASGRAYDEVLEAHEGAGHTRPGAPAIATNPYYNAYRAGDTYMVIACLNNRLRRTAAEVLGVADPRVAVNEWDSTLLDPEEAAALNQRITDTFLTRTAEEWCAEFEARGVPCGPVRITEELYDDPQVLAQDLIRELDHPLVGKIRMVSSPIQMSDAETGAPTASPALGQHTREVLRELGYSDVEVEELIEAKVVRAWD
jgi:formyl-CoA transferase